MRDDTTRSQAAHAASGPSDQGLKKGAKKGRGAATNGSGRYEAFTTEACDDGWGVDPDDGMPPLRTHVTEEHAKSIITTNRSPDISFDQSLNPYRGCEHGCVYCYARPAHAYMGLSPGLDFESRLFAKKDAAGLLKAALAKPGYRCRPLQLGANTDPYQPIERTWRLSREILEVLAAADHPVTITTKSDLVVRDLDLLGPMAAKGLASVAISLTTLEGKLARTLEPRAPRPEKRLAAMKALSGAGVPVLAMTAPMIPGLNDHEMERLLEEAAEAGAGRAAYILLRLPLELKELFEEWLDAHAPGRKGHVLSLIRQNRSGTLNDAAFESRMRGRGPYADLLERRFLIACRRLGLEQGEAARSGLRTDLFRPPRPPRADGQMDLFPGA